MVKKPLLMLVILAQLPVATCLAEDTTSHKQGKKLNCQVSSTEFDKSLLDQKLNPSDAKPVFYKAGNASLGINEDNEPNVSMNF